MHKSISKKLLSGFLAVMMVLSLVAPTISTQAASSYSFAKKTRVTAGITNTYTVYGVKKTQYVKVTKKATGVSVKYNGKTVSSTTKIKGTGKALKLRVTAPDRVAGYTNNMTVKIYNAKTNKVVKTFTAATKVTVKPLEVTNVEVASDTGKYLVAYFNKSLSTLKAADITIRQKDTNELKGIESVELSSDGKSATIALVGVEDSAENSFVKPNKDYTFTVAQSGVSASTTFVMDAVAPNVSIERVDASKNLIYDGTAGFTVPSTISVDYEEILGRTVTFWYNKDNTITKLSLADEKVVYGAFDVVKDTATATSYFEDQATGEKYYTQDSASLSGSIKTTRRIAKGTAGGTAYAYSNISGNTSFDYAKLVLNSNGTIKEAVTSNWNYQAYVTSVSGKEIYEGSYGGLDLSKFTIVKDGKTIDASEIVAGDMVFCDTTSSVRFAEVYTNAVTGTLSAVYDTKFKFEGKVYDNATAARMYGNYYSVAVDNKYMNSLLAGGEKITVYFDRSGDPVFVTGTPGTAKTTSVEMVLTKAAGTYTQALSSYIRLTGYNGEKITSYDINVEDLTTVGSADGKTSKVGYDVKTAGNRTPGISNPVKEFVVSGTSIVAVSKDNTRTDLGVIATEMPAKALVGLTLDENNKVIGIDYMAGISMQATSKNFKAGYTTVTGSDSHVYQISSDATVYLYDSNATPVEVDWTTYGEFKYTIAKDNVNSDVTFYTYGWPDDVYTVVVDLANVDDQAKNTKTYKGVVSHAYYTSGSVKVLDEFAVVCGTDETTYTSFKATGIADRFATGDIVTFVVDTDTNKVMSVTNAAIVSGPGFFADDDNVSSTKDFSIGTDTLSLATAVTPTIVKITDDGKDVEKISYAELLTLSEKNYIHSFSTYEAGSVYVDTIVVSNDDSTLATDFAKLEADKAELRLSVSGGAIVGGVDGTTATNGTTASWEFYYDDEPRVELSGAWKKDGNDYIYVTLKNGLAVEVITYVVTCDASKVTSVYVY